MHESALQEGWRGSLCVCVCVREREREEGRQHTIGAPNTRGSTQRSQQAPRNLAPETLFQLGLAWTGFRDSGGQSRCHVRVCQAPLIFIAYKSACKQTHRFPPAPLCLAHSSAAGKVFAHLKADPVTE